MGFGVEEDETQSGRIRRFSTTARALRNLNWRCVNVDVSSDMFAPLACGIAT